MVFIGLDFAFTCIKNVAENSHSHAVVFCESKFQFPHLLNFFAGHSEDDNNIFCIRDGFARFHACC